MSLRRRKGRFGNGICQCQAGTRKERLKLQVTPPALRAGELNEINTFKRIAEVLFLAQRTGADR